VQADRHLPRDAAPSRRPIRCRPAAPYVGLFLDQWVKYAVTRDTTFHSLTLDPENPASWANRISELSTQLDTSTDISAFAARGGKLLLAHGMSDVLVSTRATEVYYQRLQAQMGRPSSTPSPATTRSPASAMR
jgi:feruloyl esterase